MRGVSLRQATWGGGRATGGGLSKPSMSSHQPVGGWKSPVDWGSSHRDGGSPDQHPLSWMWRKECSDILLSTTWTESSPYRLTMTEASNATAHSSAVCRWQPSRYPTWPQGPGLATLKPRGGGGGCELTNRWGPFFSSITRRVKHARKRTGVREFRERRGGESPPPEVT